MSHSIIPKRLKHPIRELNLFTTEIEVIMA